MTEILSTAEIDALLSSISAGEGDAQGGHGGNPGLKTYDFRRPVKFFREQILTVKTIHETFARLTANSLSAQLRAAVGVRVGSVDQMTHDDFVRSVPNPTTLCVVDLDPLKGYAALEIDPGITFILLDRLFGGPGQPSKISRELSQIELSVMNYTVVRMLGNLREAWFTTVDLRPRLTRIETDPRRARIAPPAAMIVLVCFEVKIGDFEGMINLSIPHAAIERLGDRLSTSSSHAPILTSSARDATRVAKLGVEVIRAFPLRWVSLQDLSELAEGSRMDVPGRSGRSLYNVRVGSTWKKGHSASGEIS